MKLTENEAMEARLVELEIRAAFQDDLLGTLNQIIADQQKELDKLWSANKALRSQLNNLQETVKSEDDAPPPHY